jgi:Raf kinase inhibitor-like YbhB/YbcL family protein
VRAAIPGTVPLLAAAVIGTALAACTTFMQQPALTLRSDAFADGGSLPSANTCDGGDVSPQLSWTDVPREAGAFAVIVRDPDAGGFVHWVLTDIPADTAELPEGRGDSIGIPGQNDFGRVGWGGPCPPSGEHRYEFTLYALTSPLQLDGAITADDVERALGANLVGTARLTAVYSRLR